jgi:hypothetical protein
MVTITTSPARAASRAVTGFAPLSFARPGEGLGAARVGDGERGAVELLEPLVEVPSNLSKAWLRVDPTFDPLRSHPGFQALVGATS